MRFAKQILIIAMVFILISMSSAVAEKYAVLISAGEATSDNMRENSEYWYDLFLMYTTLIDLNYDHDNIYVLYGEGQDFASSNLNYQNPFSESITDYNNHKLTIASVFNAIGDIMTDDDFLYVWWMGHGARGPLGQHFYMKIENTFPKQTVWDFEFALYVNQINHYRKRVFSFMTCYSGGIINDLQGPNSIILTSSTFEETSESDILCDNWHAEFHYYETCAYSGTTPFGLCGEVDVDYDNDNWISFSEAFDHAESNMTWSTPLLSDIGFNANNSYIGHAISCCPNGIGNFGSIQTAVDAAYDGCEVLLCNYTFTGEENRNIDPLGKALTLRSRYGDPEDCIIDCGFGERGIYLHSGEGPSTIIDGITIQKGAAEMGYGGGIYCLNSSPKIINCIIFNNYAYYGSIACKNSSPIIENCKIIDNNTDWGGGGIYCWNSSPVITNCRILGNGTAYSGGAIKIGEFSSPSIFDCVITGNMAGSNGGAIYCNNSDLGVAETTISGNRSVEDGGGIYITTNSSSSVDNTIFWGNCASGIGDEIYISSSSSIDFECSDIDSIGLEGSGNVQYLPGNIFINPLFCQPISCNQAPTVEGDYHIHIYSPCAGSRAPICGRIGALDVGCYCLGICGDANDDGTVNVSDAVYIINWVFKGGDPPKPVKACGDANSDGTGNVSDAVYLINYVFVGGNPPTNCGSDNPIHHNGDCCPF